LSGDFGDKFSVGARSGVALGLAGCGERGVLFNFQCGPF
jgi:hypothetical protein